MKSFIAICLELMLLFRKLNSKGCVYMGKHRRKCTTFECKILLKNICCADSAKQKNVVGLPVKISLKSVGCWRKEKEEKNEQTKSSKRL